MMVWLKSIWIFNLYKTHLSCFTSGLRTRHFVVLCMVQLHLLLQRNMNTICALFFQCLGGHTWLGLEGCLSARYLWLWLCSWFVVEELLAIDSKVDTTTIITTIVTWIRSHLNIMYVQTWAEIRPRYKLVNHITIARKSLARLKTG